MLQWSTLAILCLSQAHLKATTAAKVEQARWQMGMSGSEAALFVQVGLLPSGWLVRRSWETLQCSLSLPWEPHAACSALQSVTWVHYVCWTAAPAAAGSS
jgi:hypothetical protein